MNDIVDTTETRAAVEREFAKQELPKDARVYFSDDGCQVLVECRRVREGVDHCYVQSTDRQRDGSVDPFVARLMAKKILGACGHAPAA